VFSSTIIYSEETEQGKYQQTLSTRLTLPTFPLSANWRCLWQVSHFCHSVETCWLVEPYAPCLWEVEQ